ncbi:hypothetical protein [Planococcus sp. CAU13]|uniref:hypothetical protein n=1 Tax=Planococcus sp. CAU13 TaxID=1541197 RepID=UPI00052FFB92|nr:hypothetical protein [Planococcus sp. CAU13]
MQEKKKNVITIPMILGMAGLLFATAGIFKLLTIVMDPMGYAMSVLGISFVIHYIYTLEKKNGVSEAFLWIRSFVMMGLLLVIYFLLY